MIPLSRPLIGEEEREAVDRVLRSGRLASGPEVEAFEAEFAYFVGVEEAVAVGSGTAALHLTLLALGIGAGDEVIVPSFTFAASANAVRLCGAEPRFAEVDEQTFCMTPDRAAALIGPRTAALLPVHLYGQPAPLDGLRSLAGRHGLALVEDAAQAHGAAWQGRQVGGWGTPAIFSFYPTKNMTTGEGGMVTTGDDGLARRLRLLRNQGMEERYRHEVVGLNERMTEIEGAIGRIQLRRLPGWLERRRENAAFYDRSLDAEVRTPWVAPEAAHAYHQYTVRVTDRDRVVRHLERMGIGYGIYYPVPTHLQPAYWGTAGSLPVTERLAREVLSIPVRPDLSAEERDRVAEALNKAVVA